ncbi:hypothetical protein NHQ30_010881 [Ciborinia camelliae]|nr:hypothetical protein NHQ30_010881 [Ciborinia camelliae]
MAASTPASDKIATISSKLRSCVVCRSRKVRCDKLSPCSNCRRANISCVVPSTDRPPRWARRLERSGNLGVASSSANATQKVDPEVGPVIERLHNLENLVKELRGQLEQANATSAHFNGDELPALDASENSHFNSSNDVDRQTDASCTAVSTSEAQNKFGRLVLQDVNRSRYISSGFWARMNDEIEGLQMETRGSMDRESDISSEDGDVLEKIQSTLEHERTSSDRHGFLFQHNLSRSDPDLSKLRPLPSQIPFLLNVYSENIHVFMKIVDIPIITNMIRDLRSNKSSSLSPANEALMFSIYYATVTSMEEDDILTNFGCTKSELSFNYRLGLEHCLAKADFLSEPDITLVQAMVIFLFLVRRQESPKFVWMMTGLVIRMAQALGLHRDGSHFPNLTPYEVETRRRVWWAVCLLDLRASEDQGTELTTTSSSVDTKIPLNIDDADLKPHTTQMPPERQGVTDLTLTVVSAEMCDVMRRLMTSGMGEGSSGAENQNLLLSDLYGAVDRRFLQYNTGSKNIASWCLSTLARMVVSKMNLILNLPVLFSSPSENHSEKVRTELLISAIEVAEYNHALNSEKDCQQWNWLFQTCTHWHAIVYLLIETSRRQWSPIVERAWAVLHSKWLIPRQLTNQSERDKNSRIWVPLRKLMTKTRKHRVAELQRLREDSWSATQLELEDGRIPLPASPVPSYDGKSDNIFRDRWRELLAIPQEIENGKKTGEPHTSVSITGNAPNTPQQTFNSTSGCGNGDLRPIDSNNLVGQNLNSINNYQAQSPQCQIGRKQTENLLHDAMDTVPQNWTTGQPLGSNTMSSSWSDADPSMGIFADMDANMDLDMDVNWYEWIESAQVMEL